MRTAWDCELIPLKEIAIAKLEAAEKGMSEKRDYAHGYKCEDYSQEESERFESKVLLDRCEDYLPEVPAPAGVITAGVDVQGDRLEIEILAHGVDDETWSLDYAVLPGDTTLPGVWNDLDKLLKTEYKHQSGNRLHIAATCVDSGYRAKEVYAFTADRWRRRIVASKGSSQLGKPLITGPVRLKIGNQRVPLITIGTDTAKDTLFEHLSLAEYGPGYCHFPKHYTKKYFDQFGTEISVEKIVKGRMVHEWNKVSGNARNEAIDLRVMNMAAIAWLNPNMQKILDDLNNYEFIKEEPEEKKNKQAARSAPEVSAGFY